MRLGRATMTVVAAAGAVSLVAAAFIAVVYGSETGGVGWLLFGPTPFYAAGLFAYWRRPDHASTRWLLTMGAGYSVSILAEYGLSAAIVHGWPGSWAIDLGYLWAGQFAGVAFLGFIGLFPVGRTEHAYEKWILRVVIVEATVLPVALTLSRPSLTADRYTFPDFPVLDSPLYIPLLSPVGPIVRAVYDASLALWFIAIVAMLARRYRHAQEEHRRQIQWLVLGTAFGVLGVVAWILPPFREYAPGSIAAALYVTLLVVGNAGMIACILIGLLRAGLLDISRILVKSLVYGTLWLVIALGYAGTAAVLGLAASQRLPVGIAVLLTIVAAMLFQPARRSLERLAGRWVFGVRESRYEVLTRFGAALEETGGLDDLLPHLAETARRGLGLRWARVRLDPSDNDTPFPEGFSGIDPDSTAEAEVVVPLVHAGTKVGDIECGPKIEGAFLDEDRQLLHNLARQAAAAVRNLRLTAELAQRLDDIRRQAGELSASRARVVQAQDAERRRLQRDLHDGAQQAVVALSAKLAMARNQLRRGDERATGTLLELHDDVLGLLHQLRELAHSIRPSSATADCSRR
jgi:signal transduction histidine kinase